MKFYGHADLQKNQIQNAALQTLSSFPSVPVVGQIAFVNSIVYICVTAGSLPIWVPLTREITAYTHTQASAASTWSITHGLNTTSVNVQVFGTDSRVVIPDEIEVTGNNTATVTFGTGVAGRAVVISGHFDGNVKPTYSYTHYQSSASTTWVIVHNLGYNPIVRVFIGNQEVQPLSITHDSTNQVTITFNTAQVGYARLI
jgi:hypothetical protein